MLKQQSDFLKKIGICFDLFALVLAFGVAYLIRSEYIGKLLPILDYLWVILVAAPVWYFLLNRYGLYSSIRRTTIYDIVTRMINVHILGGFIVASMIYFLEKDQYSRRLYLTFIACSFILMTLEKVVLRFSLGVLRSKGFNTRNLLIVGTREKARKFHKLLEDHSDWGMVVLGFVQVLDEPLTPEVEGHQVLGYVRDLQEICKIHPVDEVVFCLPKDYLLDAEEHVQDLEELGITVRMVLDFYDVYLSKRELSLFHDELPILSFHTRSLDTQQLFFKRALDIAGALAGLVLLGVMLPFIAFAIRRDSPGPIFFGQERVGESGRIFKCWKFRSMYLDAEERKKELMEQNEMKGAIFKIKNDPRITRVGAFLRKTSLDEFPQFWNVLRGEMSLVGTRPPTPGEVAQYENWHRRRISIKPGITGKWQVSGRNRIEDFDEIVRLDLDYIDSWNLWLDIRILFRTVTVVFAKDGSF